MTQPRKTALIAASSGAAVLLIAVLVAVVVFQTEWFRERVRERIIYEVETATGGRVEIGSFHFNARELWAEVGPFVLHGTEPAGSAPLFRAERVHVGLRVISALRRDVNIAALIIDRPEVNLIVLPDGGTNFPQPKVARQPGRHPVEQFVNLEVRRFELREGAFHYDGRNFPLDLKGENLHAKFAYEAAHPRYRGEVSVRPLEVASGTAGPLRLEFDTAVAIERNALRIERAMCRNGETQIDASGAIEGFRDPRGEFDIKARLGIADLAGAIALPVERRGSVRFEGKASFGGGAPFALAGAVAGEGLAYRYAQALVDPIRMSGDLRVTPETVTLSGLRVRALDGSFAGQAELRGMSEFQVTGRIEGFSLVALAGLQLRQKLPWNASIGGDVKIAGRVAEGALTGTTAALDLGVRPQDGSEPVEGEVHIVWNQQGGTIDFANSFVATPATRVNFNGTLGKRLRVGIYTSNLDEALPVIALISEKPVEPLPVKLHQGFARFEGEVVGPLDDPRIAGQGLMTRFEARHERFEGRFERISADIELSRGMASIRNLALTKERSQMEGDASAVLADWRFDEANSKIEANFSVKGVEIEHLLTEAGQKLPVSGVLSGAVEVSGTVREPRGESRLRIDQLSAYGERVDGLDVRIEYDGSSLRVTDGAVRIGASRLRIQGSYNHAPDDRTRGEVQFEVAGTGLPLSASQTIRQRLASIQGRLEVKAAGAGRLEGKRFQLTALDGTLAIRNLGVENKTLGAVFAQADTREDSLAIRANMNVRSSSIRLTGAVDLTEHYPVKAEVAVGRFDFSDVEALFADDEFARDLPFFGYVEGGGTFAGPADDVDAIEGQLRLTALSLTPKAQERIRPGAEAELTLRNNGPVRMSMSSQGIGIQAAEFVAKDTHLSVGGTFGFRSRTPWDLKVKGRMNMAVLDVLRWDILAEGISTVDTSIRGNFAQPQVNGRMELSDASFYVRGIPNGIEKANGVILFDRNRATISKFTAQTGGGNLSIGGFVSFGAESVYRLQAKADRVRVRYPDGVSTTVNADLNFTGATERSMLAGTVTVLRTGFNPRTDLGSILAASSKPIQTPVTPNPFLQGMQLDIRIQTAPNVQFQTALTRDIQMEADLRLRGGPNKPVLLGTALVSQGEIQFFGNKYTINRGEVSFLNTALIEPVVDMDLETRIRGVIVNINFSGPINKLNVTYRSDPPLQSSEIIALLAVGRAPTAVPTVGTAAQRGTQNQSAFQTGANTLLGQAITAPVSSRLERFFGVSRLKIDPMLTGVDNTPQARLTMEQQISPDITITYITNITRSQQQIVRLEWDMNRQWSVVAVRDENGMFGIDFLYRKRFK
ncbi:MAG: translocation/assembly module TamB domain-containing protein [Bryobacteraceae bacterium]